MSSEIIRTILPGGAILDTVYIDDDRLQRTAIHEAAHAVVAHEVGAPITHVTIEPDEGRGGHVKCDKNGLSLRQKIMVYLASSAAQTTLKGGQVDPRGCGGDMLKARRHAHKLGPGTLVAIGLETHALISRRWADVRRVAHALLEHRTLSGEQVRKVLDDG